MPKENKKTISGKIFKTVFNKSGYILLALALLLSQAGIFSAFEAHIVNVRAKVCRYSETKTIGYWKTHSYIYVHYLPLVLGSELVETEEAVDGIFKQAEDMPIKNALKAQLLAMKFNVLHFGIGDYSVEGGSKTLSQVVEEADEFLKREPQPPEEELTAIAGLLDELNDLRQIRYCSDNGFEQVLGIADYNPEDNCLKINEVYYRPDESHGSANNEWIELYNACDYSINLYDWYLESSTGIETLDDSYVIESKGFVVIAGAAETWSYWDLLPLTVKISLGKDYLFNHLGDISDWLILYDNKGNVVDIAAWGSGIAVFTPPVAGVESGHSIARKEKGVDTDTKEDWEDLEEPNPGNNPHPPKEPEEPKEPLLFLGSNSLTPASTSTDNTTSTDNGANSTSTDPLPPGESLELIFQGIIGPVLEVEEPEEPAAATDEAAETVSDENTTTSEPYLETEPPKGGEAASTEPTPPEPPQKQPTSTDPIIDPPDPNNSQATSSDSV